MKMKSYYRKQKEKGLGGAQAWKNWMMGFYCYHIDAYKDKL